MGQQHSYLAIDLGAESYCLIKGFLADSKPIEEESPKFMNRNKYNESDSN